MNRMEQLEPDFRSLEESEKLLFSSIAEQENEKENTKNSFI